MLTSDLVRVRVTKGVLRPSFIDPEAPRWSEPCEGMVAAVGSALAEGWDRGTLEEALASAAGDARQAKVLRGFAKLLLDRCEFETVAPEDPRALRERVFRAAQEVGPLALEAGPLGRPTAHTVLAEVAAGLGCSPEDVEQALYADLPKAQILTQARPWSAEQLPHRYNLALVQAVLLHAEEVVLDLKDPTPARLRQLMHHARFCRLMVRASRQDDRIVLVFDGPGSVLKRSTSYGLDLARFFHAVPRLDVPWTLRAPVRWGPRKRPATLEVSSADGLRSMMRDAGGHQAPEVAQLVERWPADAALQPTDRVLPIPLGDRGLLLPDLAFSDGQRTAYLEVAGWWRRAWLDRHLEGLARHGRADVVVAVSRRMCVDRKVDDLPVSLVTFGQVLPVSRLQEALEAAAR